MKNKGDSSDPSYYRVTLRPTFWFPNTQGYFKKRSQLKGLFEKKVMFGPVSMLTSGLPIVEAILCGS